MSGAREEIRLQVMWNRLIAVVEEQAQALLRTAFGAVVREAGDLSAGVYDLDGRMLAQAVTGTPGHVNTMATAVRHFLDRFPIGDDGGRRRLRHQRPVDGHRPPVRLRRGVARLQGRPPGRALRLDLPSDRCRRPGFFGGSQLGVRGRRALSAHEAARARRAAPGHPWHPRGQQPQPDRGARRPAVAGELQRRGLPPAGRHDGRV